MTVRLTDTSGRDADNATKVRWGAVLGRAEAFTAEELFLFPDYVLRNHGDAWNERGDTLWKSFLLALALLLAWRAVMMFLRTWPGFSRCCPRYDCLGLTQVIWPCLWSTRARNPGKYKAKPYEYEVREECFPSFDRGRRVYAREILYVVAVLSFNTAAIEMVWHLVIAHEVDWSTVDRGFYVGIFLVLFSQGLPLLLVWIIHNGILYRDRVRKMAYRFQDCLPCCDHGVPGERGLAAFFCHACHAIPKPETNTTRSTLYCVACWTCSTSPSWWIVELGTAVSLLFWFGAGFYVGPAALAVAALLRVSEYGVDPMVPLRDLDGDGGADDGAAARARRAECRHPGRAGRQAGGRRAASAARHRRRIRRRRRRRVPRPASGTAAHDEDARPPPVRPAPGPAVCARKAVSVRETARVRASAHRPAVAPGDTPI